MRRCLPGGAGVVRSLFTKRVFASSASKYSFATLCLHTDRCSLFFELDSKFTTPSRVFLKQPSGSAGVHDLKRGKDKAMAKHRQMQPPEI